MTRMKTDIMKLLADLEERIDEPQEERVLSEWKNFLEGRFKGDIFRVRRRESPARVAWPDININDAVEDFDLMFASQFSAISGSLTGGGGNVLNVRANYGTGILPSLFGCEFFAMPRQTNTLPAAKPLADIEKIRRLADAGPADINGGLGGKVFEFAERYLEITRKFPKISKYVWLYHPDMQGPIDALEVVWGSEIFIAFYDEPDLMRRALEAITQTYSLFMRKWYELVPPAGPYSAHWGFLQKGNLMIREDSLMNLSPDLYVEFIRPLDQRLFDEFGGGAVHFCGRGDHYIQTLSELKGLTAINMSQPEYNDMEIIFKNTVDKGLAILGLPEKAAQEAIVRKRPLNGRVHSW